MIWLYGLFVGWAAASPGRVEAEARPTLITGSLEVAGFAARQSQRDVAAFSPRLQLGLRVRTEVELTMSMGAATMFADQRSFDGTKTRAAQPSNFVFGAGWIRDAPWERHHGRLGVAFSLPTTIRPRASEAEALHLAAGARGGLDPWQWAPATAAVVVPGGWAWHRRSLEVGIDAAVAGLIASSGNSDRPGVAGQVLGRVGGIVRRFRAGVAVSAVANSRQQSDPSQLAAGPYVDVALCRPSRLSAPCAAALTGALTVNLDEPLGFVGEGLRVWGVTLGLRWLMREPE